MAMSKWMLLTQHLKLVSRLFLVTRSHLLRMGQLSLVQICLACQLDSIICTNSSSTPSIGLDSKTSTLFLILHHLPSSPSTVFLVSITCRNSSSALIPVH